jgi:acetoacetyl-CoA synthetase
MTPIWTPSRERRDQAALTQFCRAHADLNAFADAFDYQALHKWSVANRETFWSRLWDFCGVIGEKGARILDNGDAMPGSQWFPDARLNFAENLLRDREDDARAIVFYNDRFDRQLYSFAGLKRSVAALAAHFRARGVVAGDTVAAYTHNAPEAVIGMLAAASIGAIWASCSPDFGVAGALSRFQQISPKILIATDGYYYKGQRIGRLDHAREIAAKLDSVEETLILPYVDARPSLEGLKNAKLWTQALEEHAGAPLEFAQLPFNQPLYVMFSSGTTGAPKCIVHGAGGTLLQHLKEHRLQSDVRPGDAVFFATTTGWMMWNWLVSALASKAAIVLFDGYVLERDGRIMFDLAAAEGATLFGTSAGFLKAVEKGGLVPRESHDLSKLRLLASTGSPLSESSYDYVYRDIKSDLHLASISGGTDIISCFVLGNPWAPIYRGEIQGAGLGMAVEVFDPSGARIFEEQGELVCTRSFPSMPLGFMNDPEGTKYRASYFSSFPNIWRHGDYALETQRGGFVIFGRSDATLNVEGVRIGTAEIYAVLETMREIEGGLAIERQMGDKSHMVLFVKLRQGHALDEALAKEIRRKLRAELSPRHAPANIIAAPDLPHTKSGKLVELAVRDAVHGKAATNAEALANPEALGFFATLGEEMKAGKSHGF